MPEILMKNAGRVAAGQGQKIDKGEVTGRLHMLYDERTFTAEALANDTLKFGAPLPPGARVISGRFISPDVGGTGTLKWGHQANGVDVADDDAFGASMDNSGQALDYSAVGAGIGKKFSVATQVELTFNGNTASLTGKTLQGWLLYVVD